MTSPFEQADFDQFDGAGDGDAVAFCLTVVQHADTSDVLDILLPRRRPEKTTWAGARDLAVEAFDEAGGSPVAAAAFTGDGWCWVWEDNGYRGSLVRTMTRLSDLGRAVSTYRTASKLSSFVLAERRRVVRRFEPLRRGVSGAVSVGEALRDEPLLDWDRPTSAAVTLLANLSGVYPDWPQESDEAFVYYN